MSGIIGIILGFILGYWYRSSKIEKTPKTKRRTFTYTERQKRKTEYESDADRIRELNRLDNNESKFMRILQHEFTSHHVIVKNKRFYIADQDMYPIAIFEYRNGTKMYMGEDTEDGLPVFIYKGILSSTEIKKAHHKIGSNVA